MSEQDERRGVTDEEIANAMQVTSMPDETRSHGNQDETEQVVGSEGEIRRVEPESPAAMLPESAADDAEDREG
jgi:hypothetical protein